MKILILLFLFGCSSGEIECKKDYRIIGIKKNNCEGIDGTI